MRPLTLAEIGEETAGALVGGEPETAVTSVSTDSRTLAPGALFVALRGENHDGHQYVPAAQERGAAALLVEQTLHTDTPHIVVLDTLRAYGDLARYYRDTFPIPVIAVTGSVGKTTVKEMIAQTLSQTYTVQKSAVNFNNEIGVPQTIFGLEERHTALVLEMGMRGTGQIFRLAEIGGPTIGVITNIGLSHVELLGSREAIADAKGELLDALHPQGVAVLPGGDEFTPRLRRRFAGEILTCAVEATGDIVAAEAAQQDNGWRFTVSSPWGRAEMFLPSPGRFNIENALFAVAVAGRLGVPLEAIADALKTWTPPALRMEIVTTPGGVTVLADAYNASPTSMIGALETLRDMPVTGRRIAVLGEMRELGDFAEEGHASVGRAAARADLDRLVLVGPLTRALGDAALAAGWAGEKTLVLESSAAAADVLPSLIAPGDAVLVKGSRALAMEQIVAALAPPVLAPPAPNNGRPSPAGRASPAGGARNISPSPQAGERGTGGEGFSSGTPTPEGRFNSRSAAGGGGG